MGPLSHVFVPSSGRLGPARAEVGLGFAVVGWFRRFRLPPPPLVWFRFRRPSFFLPLPFQGLPALGQVCRVGVCSFPLLLRSPLRDLAGRHLNHIQHPTLLPTRIRLHDPNLTPVLCHEVMTRGIHFLVIHLLLISNRTNGWCTPRSSKRLKLGKDPTNKNSSGSQKLTQTASKDSADRNFSSMELWVM